MSSLEQLDSDNRLGRECTHSLVNQPPLRQNNHHSDTDKMITNKNSLTSTKISEWLVLLATLHKTKCLKGILDTVLA